MMFLTRKTPSAIGALQMHDACAIAIEGGAQWVVFGGASAEEAGKSEGEPEPRRLRS